MFCRKKGFPSASIHMKTGTISKYNVSKTFVKKKLGPDVTNLELLANVTVTLRVSWDKTANIFLSMA